MMGFKYFFMYNVFYFTIIGFFILGAIYFACFPSDRRHLNAVMQKIKATKSKEKGSLEKQIQQQGGSLAGALAKGAKK